jgi:hypothetical protein
MVSTLHDSDDRRISTAILDRNRFELPADLHGLVRNASQAGEAVRAAEAEYAYRLALVARAALGRRAGAESAIDACSAALGVSRQSLQPFALVATRWASHDLLSLFTRRCSNGRPLSMSHLLLLVRLPRTDREVWANRALQESLDVRQLREAISASRKSNGKWVKEGRAPKRSTR